jgi:hypothetical protein
MDFGLFLEFTAPGGTPDQETFTEGFSTVDAAESLHLQRVEGPSKAPAEPASTHQDRSCVRGDLPHHWGHGIPYLHQSL